MIGFMVDQEEIARVAKGMLEETANEYVSMGIMLLAAKLCFPEAYETDRPKAVDWMIHRIEALP
jgi:hypothetical protein